MAIAEQLKGGITPGEQVKPDINVPSLGQFSEVINGEKRIRVNEVFEKVATFGGFLGLGFGMYEWPTAPLWGLVMLADGATLVWKSVDIKNATTNLRVELKRLKRESDRL